MYVWRAFSSRPKALELAARDGRTEGPRNGPNEPRKGANRACMGAFWGSEVTCPRGWCVPRAASCAADGAGDAAVAVACAPALEAVVVLVLVVMVVVDSAAVLRCSVHTEFDVVKCCASGGWLL